MANLLNKYLQLGIFSTLLLTSLFIFNKRANAIEESKIKIALQENIPRQHNNTRERQQRWQQRQENIERQRIQRQQLELLENQQKTQNFQRKIETNRQQYQRSQQNRHDFTQRVQQQQQRYQNNMEQKQILAPPVNGY